MKCQIISIVKRTMGFLLCICLAGLFMLLMTWLILELQNEPQSAANRFGVAASVPMAGQGESWEYWARADEAWRDEFMQNMVSMQDELYWDGFEYGQSGDNQGP